MTDEEWAVVRPLLPVPGRMRGRGGQPEAYCHRQMLDAIRYLVDNGIKWRAMPRWTSRRGTRCTRCSAAGATTPWSRSSTTGCAVGCAKGWAGMRSRRPG
ncbi:transposase [Streptomyces mirabilis]